MFRDLLDVMSGWFIIGKSPKAEEDPPTPLSPISLKKEEMAEFLSVEGTDDASVNILVMRKGKKLMWSPLNDESLRGLITGLQHVARMRGLE